MIAAVRSAALSHFLTLATVAVIGIPFLLLRLMLCRLCDAHLCQCITRLKPDLCAAQWGSARPREVLTAQSREQRLKLLLSIRSFRWDGFRVSCNSTAAALFLRSRAEQVAQTLGWLTVLCFLEGRKEHRQAIATLAQQFVVIDQVVVNSIALAPGTCKLGPAAFGSGALSAGTAQYGTVLCCNSHSSHATTVDMHVIVPFASD